MDAPLPHTLDPESGLWDELADCCLEHDIEHERHVLEQLRQVHVPTQREGRPRVSACEDPDGVHDFPEVEILDDDEDSYLKAGMKVIAPCQSCGMTPLEQMDGIGEQLEQAQTTLSRVLADTDRPLFHWSPARNRKQIERLGLVSGRLPCTNAGEDYGAPSGWRAPFVCLATTPSWAWALSGGQRGSPKGEWDLWQTWAGRLDGLEVLPGHEADGVHEVRVHGRIYKRHLWLVGTRAKP